MSNGNIGDVESSNRIWDEYGEKGSRGKSTSYASARRTSEPVQETQDQPGKDNNYETSPQSQYSNKASSRPGYRESLPHSGYHPVVVEKSDSWVPGNSNPNTEILKRNEDDYGPTGNPLDDPDSDNRDYDSYGSADENMKYSPPHRRTSSAGGLVDLSS